jgi:S-layer protein (TIGR01564 family)
LTNQYTVYVTSSVEDGIQVANDNLGDLSADVRTNRMWLVWNDTGNGTSVWYRNSAGAKVHAGVVQNDTANQNVARVYYGDTKSDNVEIDLTSAVTSGAGYVNVTLDVSGKATSDLQDGEDDMRMYWEVTSKSFSNLGVTASTEEADELQAKRGTATYTNIGTKDEDHRSNYGVVIMNPKSHGASDEAVFKVPNEQVFAKVSVKSTGSTTTTASGGVKQVVPVTNAVAKLDTEVSLPVGKHLVLVGGPAVNRLSAQAMGLTYPTYGGSGLLPFAEGEGYVALVDGVLESGKYAVVVAGWEADQTRDACSVLQQFGSFSGQLDGNMAVKVSSVSASGITAA